MAKNKFGKFIALTAIVGAAAAAGTAYFMKKVKMQDASDFEDDDFEDDLDDEDFDFPDSDQTEAPQREYVSLNIESPKKNTDVTVQDKPTETTNITNSTAESSAATSPAEEPSPEEEKPLDPVTESNSATL